MFGLLMVAVIIALIKALIIPEDKAEQFVQNIGDFIRGLVLIVGWLFVPYALWCWIGSIFSTSF